ncbi:hypothetical protein GDO81_022522 [Engystomops pustulosus]|uniref:Uncharacterized protein n=1 Tax=Engystomops pustulosus TaxID=76066 RepID=A0AAV6ZDT6_ENGPU|nr:hypothetical protein GDO81_022522 [Engystomops pustulosus]
MLLLLLLHKYKLCTGNKKVCHRDTGGGIQRQPRNSLTCSGRRSTQNISVGRSGIDGGANALAHGVTRQRWPSQ